MFDYIYCNERRQFSFIRLPQILFTNEQFRSLSSDSKILYALLLDRTGLSIKNHWIDSEGKVFINFPIAEIAEKLGIGLQKAGKILRELDVFGLIERLRLGLGKPDRIFVKHCVRKTEVGESVSDSENNVEVTEESVPSDTSDSSFLNCENHHSGNVKIAGQDIPKSSFPLYSQTKRVTLNKSDHIYQSAGQIDEIDFIEQRDSYEQIIKDNIEYDWFSEAFSMPHDKHRLNGSQEELDDMVTIMPDCVCSSATTVRVNGENMPTEVVRAQFLKLSSEHIQYVFDCLYQHTSEVTNVRAYLITTLYNASVTMNTAFGFDFRSTFGSM